MSQHYHDNKVSFTSPDLTIIGVTFTITDFCITSGQDPDGHIYAGLEVTADSSMTLHFSIGRHGSSDCANWFERILQPAQNTFDNNPGSLNFALLGVLTLTFGAVQPQTYSFSDIMLAQGHAGATNNWWFGGTNCSYVGDNTVSCADDSNQVTLYFSRGGVNYPTVDEITVSDTNPNSGSN